MIWCVIIRAFWVSFKVHLGILFHQRIPKSRLPLCRCVFLALGVECNPKCFRFVVIWFWDWKFIIIDECNCWWKLLIRCKTICYFAVSPYNLLKWLLAERCCRPSFFLNFLAGIFVPSALFRMNNFIVHQNLPTSTCVLMSRILFFDNDSFSVVFWISVESVQSFHDFIPWEQVL